MAKYIANPVGVDAFEIKDVERHGDVFILELEDGRFYETTPGMTAREEPEVGGYLVTQADGYTYINPKHVFERKYRRA